MYKIKNVAFYCMFWVLKTKSRLAVESIMKLNAKIRYHEYIFVYKDMLHIKYISHCQFENVKILRASSG